MLEVVRSVDDRFSTLRNRRDRVIAGFSAGGYGAMNIALHHLSVFGNVQAWSGYYLQTRNGVFAHASRAELAANSPLVMVGRERRMLARDPLSSVLLVGRDDSSAVQQAPMARALSRLGQPVQTAVYPGGHDWSVWYPRLNAMLIAASQATVSPSRRPRLPSVSSRRRRDRVAPARPLGAPTIVITVARIPRPSGVDPCVPEPGRRPPVPPPGRHAARCVRSLHAPRLWSVARQRAHRPAAWPCSGRCCSPSSRRP